MKKVIGYKINSKRLLEASNALIGLGTNLELSKKGTHFKEGSVEHKTLDVAGVTGLWCTAIYKEMVTFKKGGWYKRIWDDGDTDVFRVSNNVKKEGVVNYDKLYFRNGKLLPESSGGEDVEDVESFSTDTRYEVEVALHKEVEKLMIAEALRKGYKKGNYKCLCDNEEEYNLDKSIWHYCNTYNSIFTAKSGNGGSCMFKAGVWATFKTESPVLPEIKGYEGSDDGKHIVYGCTEFKKKRLRALLDLRVTEFKIKTPEGIVTIDGTNVKMLEAYLQKN